MKNILYLLLFVSAPVFSQNGQAYQIYNAKGKKVTYDKMVKQLQDKDVVLFGEFHDNSLAHWLQLELTKSLAQKRGLTLGAEMIEADNQSQLNDYLAGKIDQKAFDTIARLWNNHKTDYKPLVDFAKKSKIRFIATNVPRRYASKVYKEGVESLELLSAEEKSWIAPLPFPYDENLPGYVKMMEMFKDSNHANPNFPKSQAIKDATMAYFISKNIEAGKLFVHFNGSYHSNNYEGIYWYLNTYNQALKVATIATVSQAEVKKMDPENKNLADFIIVIDEDMTKTF
ncbi:ChaN family lipoprotein [Myroides ceti]|uniref:ChaN family lipoprotein n=1 Tax=Paenimyroides ceti TaxID=395087 RepID=A0ABT8CXX4_9FLAO|nr:ChaN family lipoprotein [Paenimyroides ceti]MDN3708473.1 ChaN family lipoprotein [Paenimyroides ceti]